MLLPSDMSKSAVYRFYVRACESDQVSCVSRRTFENIWKEWDVFIYLIAKLEYTVWGSWALFRVVLPIEMYGAAVFNGVFFCFALSRIRRGEGQLRYQVSLLLS